MVASPEGGLTGACGPFLHNASCVLDKLCLSTAMLVFQNGCLVAITAGQTIEVKAL